MNIHKKRKTLKILMVEGWYKINSTFSIIEGK